MSFLIDPPWLYASGEAFGRLAPEAAQGRVATAAGAATAAAFLITSTSLYLDRAWTRPIWRACRARSGRDWMLNSGVLKLEADRPGAVTHGISALLFASYPLWLWLGWDHARRAR
ncbi:MAG: hypothetical protein NVS2B6_14510 [Thermoleophilaceae bacterium]